MPDTLNKEETNMSTYMPKAAEVERSWYILDAADKPLGRVAATAAHLQIGRAHV